jgi:hypothetical protein
VVGTDVPFLGICRRCSLVDKVMTGMGRPKHFQPFGRELLILAVILVICWVSKDYWG